MTIGLIIFLIRAISASIITGYVIWRDERCEAGSVRRNRFS